MSKVMRLSLVLILVLFAAQAAHAEASKDKLVNELYVKSGLEKQINSTPAVMMSMFDQKAKNDPRLNSTPEAGVAKTREILVAAFTARRIEEAVKASLASKLEIKEMREVLKWLDSPLGKKATKAEEAASTPEGQAEIQKFAGQLQQSPPSKNRLELIIGIDQANRMTESMVEMVMRMNRAIGLSLALSVAQEMRRPVAEVLKEIEAAKSQIESGIRETITITNLYLYRDLSDAEIEQYIRFGVSEAGQKFSFAVWDGMEVAFIEASLKMGTALGEDWGQPRNRTPEKKGI